MLVEVRRKRNLNFFADLKLIQNQPVFIIVYLSEFDRVLCACQMFPSFQIQNQILPMNMKTRSFLYVIQNSIVPTPKNGGKYEIDQQRIGILFNYIFKLSEKGGSYILFNQILGGNFQKIHMLYHICSKN